jgi:3-hydroxyacyl-CoA dehydrogenase
VARRARPLDDLGERERLSLKHAVAQLGRVRVVDLDAVLVELRVGGDHAVAECGRVGVVNFHHICEPEHLELKKQLFRELDALLDTSTYIGSAPAAVDRIVAEFGVAKA